MTALRMMAYVFTAMPIMLGVILLTVFPPETRFAAPATWLVVAQIVLAIIIFVLCQTVFSRARAIPRGTPTEIADPQALAAQSTLFFYRFTACEVLAVGSVAAAFVALPSSWLSYATGGFLSFALCLLHVIPNERTTARVKESLERDGARVTVL